jgi:hypothetical protein
MTAGHWKPSSQESAGPKIAGQVLCQTLLLAGLVFHQRADALELGFHKCVPSAGNTCASALELRNAARTSGLLGSMQYGSYILATTDARPLSALTTVCQGPPRQPGWPPTKTLCLVTPDDIGAFDLDQSIHARALAIEPVDIPPAIATGPFAADIEVIQHHLATVIDVSGAPPCGYALLHEWWPPVSPYCYVLDLRFGMLHKVWINDVITVRYSNGQTEQFKFGGPTMPSGQFWMRVEGTIKNADGTPWVPATPPAATAAGGGIALATPWGASVQDSVTFLICSVIATTCVGNDCFHRQYDRLCP